MKGIIFVVWEKYLNDTFGPKFLSAYRKSIGESDLDLPMTARTYPDENLLLGLKTVSQMAHMTEDRLMIEYGRYFMLNGLVEYLCGYLLAQAWSGYDLLLLMRDAHAQMRRTPDGLTPPLFAYEVLSDDHQHMILTYDSKRKLCSLLEGCIYGSAERFGEEVRVREHVCMKRGSSVCRFEVLFKGESWAKRATPEMLERERKRLSNQGLTNLILQVLPYQMDYGVTLRQLQSLLNQHQGSYFPEIYKRQRHLEEVHISQVYSSLAKLQQVGLVASTTNRPGDTFENRLYWCAPRTDY